jgi:hypothetical protein
MCLFLILLGIVTQTACHTIKQPTQSQFSAFIGLTDFSRFKKTTGEKNEISLTSQEITAPIFWNELIVSWNVEAPVGTWIKIEAAAQQPGHQTKFYTIANWSPDNKTVARTSLPGQKDADGTVDTDTLVLAQPARAVQLRVTLYGTNGQLPALKFVGLAFADTKTPVVVRESNHQAWGKIIATPEHSQHGYPNEKGWCSPTSLSMVLSRWALVLNRPGMDLTVPQVAAAVYDEDFKGTGNWPFNTAFAGSFPDMKSYVTRLDDLAEVEDWINAGIPVVLSARWDWLLPGRPLDKDGHLIVCIGFTENGDVVINDPATRLEKGERVQRIYKRADVIRSWTKSHNAVYLVYPTDVKIPKNRYGHW